MKNIISLRYIATITIALIITVATASAQITSEISEVKIKFTSLTQEAKSKIETITSILKGVSESSVGSDNKTLNVKYDANQITSDMLVYAIKAIGYVVDSVEEIAPQTESKVETKEKEDKQDKS